MPGKKLRQRLLIGFHRGLRRLVDEVSTGRLEIMAPGNGLSLGLALGHALENAVRHDLHQGNVQMLEQTCAANWPCHC